MSQVFYWRPRCDSYSSVSVGIRLPQNVPCVLLQWLCWLFLKWPGAAPLLNWGWTSLVPSVPLWGGTVQRASQVPSRWPPREWHSPTSTGFFQQHRNTTTLCSSGWGCHIQKSKNTNTTTTQGAPSPGWSSQLYSTKGIQPALHLSTIQSEEYKPRHKNTNAFEPASSAASPLAPANTGAQRQAQDKPLFFTAASPHHFPWK